MHPDKQLHQNGSEQVSQIKVFDESFIGY